MWSLQANWTRFCYSVASCSVAVHRQRMSFSPTPPWCQSNGGANNGTSSEKKQMKRVIHTSHTRSLGEEIDNINSDFMKWAPFFKKEKIPSSLPLATLRVLLGKLRNAYELKIQLSERKTLRWHSGLSLRKGLLWNRAGQSRAKTRLNLFCDKLVSILKRNLAREGSFLFPFSFVSFFFSFLRNSDSW